MQSRSVNERAIPLGLSMAMAQYPLALENFMKLTDRQRADMIDSARELRSSKAVKSAAASLSRGELPRFQGFF